MYSNVYPGSRVDRDASYNLTPHHRQGAKDRVLQAALNFQRIQDRAKRNMTKRNQCKGNKNSN